MSSNKEKKVKSIPRSKGTGDEKYPDCAISPNNLLSDMEKQLHMYPVNIISVAGRHLAEQCTRWVGSKTLHTEHRRDTGLDEKANCWKIWMEPILGNKYSTRAS